MPSPFPGMNPYFERRDYWMAVHSSFLVHLQGAINPLVVPRYTIDLEERLFIDRSGDGYELFAVADTSLTDSSAEAGSFASSPARTAPVTGTISIPRPIRRRRRWLTVRDTRKRTVVTVIELLSPSDKRSGRDRDRYLDKRSRILASTANLVEIDLLQGGQRMPVEGLPACDYCVVVSRRSERPRAGVWPFSLREPLPEIPIPLRPGEVEPVIPLKPVLDRTYDEGGYVYKVYDAPPEPPLSADDAAWARGVLAAATPPTPTR
jgi:Protein of unknown function (DUF4058)